MDNKALYKLTYGIFMVSSRMEQKISGCITDTCIQVAVSPARIVISCMNSNYTCEIIKESGYFALSILDQTCSFATICHFGFQSGRKVDKFANMKILIDMNGLPYLVDECCAVLSCKVIQSIDLHSHTLFIAEVQDAKVLNSTLPLTYLDYQTKLKK